MENQTSGSDSDAPKILSDDGTLSDAAFDSLLSKSSPFEEAEAAEAEEAQTEETEEVESEEEEEVEETEAEPEEEPEETEETEEESEEVLSQIDWESADWDNFDWESIPSEVRVKLADKAGGSVGHVIGDLRKKKAEAEKRAEAAEAQLKEGISTLESAPAEFKDFTKPEELDAKAKEWSGQLTYINNLLDTPDEFFDINGQDYTREQVVGYRKYYEQLVSKVPQQRQRLKDMSSFSESAVVKEVTQDLPELADEDSGAYKAWRAIVDAPEMAVIKHIAPRQFAKILKLAAHSVAFTSKKSLPTGKLPMKKAKNIGTRSNGARSTKASNSKSRERQAAQQRIQSGEYTEKDLELMMFGR